MKLKLSNITRKKLVLVKRVFQQAVTDAAISDSYHRRLLAIIGFDWAVETTLKTILRELNPNAKLWNKWFDELVKEVNHNLKNSESEIPEAIPKQADIDFIRDIRNSAQHSATIPSVDDLNSCRVYVRDFLRTVYADFWGEDFDRFSLASVIEHEEIRNELLNAETALAEEKRYDAAFFATRAFYLGIREHAGLRHIDNTFQIRTEFGSMIEPIVDRIEDLQTKVDTMALGIDLAEYYRFNQLTNRFTLLPNDVLLDLNPGEETFEENEVHFLVSFSTNTILLIQERYGWDTG